MSYKTSDREYYRKAAGYLKAARYMVLVILVIFIIFSMTVYREEITVDNFRYLLRYIDIQPPEFSLGDRSVSFSVGEDAQFSLLGDKLCVFDDGRVSSYDFSGRKLFSDSLSYVNPVSVSNDKYFMIYDMYGKNISIYNSFSKIAEKELDTEIEYIYLDTDGSFVVITKEKSYSSGFVVYDSNFHKSYSFMSRDMTITDIALDSSGDTVVCATTGSHGGDYYSKILFFDISTEEPPQTLEIFGQMPLSLLCSDGKFSLVTDCGIHYFNKSGEKTGEADFGLDTLKSVYRFRDFFAVGLKTAETGVDMVARFYDYQGKELLTTRHKSEIFNISHKDGDIFILEHFLLRAFKYSGGVITENSISDIAADGEYKKVFSGGADEYVLVSSGGALKQKINYEPAGENGEKQE